MKRKLIAVALITVLICVGLGNIVACTPTPTTEYDLTISSTAGGSVTTPGEAGPYTYDEGTVVDLVAEAEEGYEFVEWSGDVGTIANVNGAATTITMNNHYSITANFEANFMVSAGCYHTVGLKSNGTVVAVGSNDGGQCEVGGWTGIVQVAAGCGHTVGLKSNGTVVAVADHDDGECEVGGWTGIVQVAAGCGHTVGLKSNGTVIAVGDNFHGQCEVGGWTDIIGVAAGDYHTVGLKSDGTVVAVGYNDHEQCEVGGWDLN
jgi:alpha-tubulin suppressor-like RCC1 family protein